MPSLKAIKRRIGSVKSTRQITKAMDLVAAAKLARVKARLEASRALGGIASGMIDELCRHPVASASIYATPPAKSDTSAYLVISGERGLCGGYNTNISRLTLEHIRESGKDEYILALGVRGQTYLTRRGMHVRHSMPGLVEKADYHDAEMIARLLLEGYIAGKYDEVFVSYTKFASTVSHTPTVERVLPLEVAEDKGPLPSPVGEMRYESGPVAFLEEALPTCLAMFIHSAMVESSVCEQAARMVSMDAASKNADDIIENLTLTYNRSRQQAITQEINEIVGGANAV